MSFYDDIPPLDLRPSESRPTSNGLVNYPTLLRWIMYNPYALEYYVKEFVCASPLSPAAARRCFLYHVAKFIVLALLIIEFCDLLISLNRLPTQRIYMHVLVSAGLGIMVAGLLLEVVGSYSAEPAIATIWAFQFGVGLPILHLLEMWVRDKLFVNQLLLLLIFNLFFGALFGILLNSITNHLANQFIEVRIQGLVRGLALLLFYLGIFIIALYDTHFVKPLNLGSFILCLCCAVAAAAGFAFRLDNLLYAILHQPEEPPTVAAWYVPRVTPILPPLLQRKLLEWLADSWPSGLENAHQLWQHTNLRYPVAQQIVVGLSRERQQLLVEYTTALLNPRYRWRLYHFVELRLSLEALLVDLYERLLLLLHSPAPSKVKPAQLPRSRTFENQVARLIGVSGSLARQPRINQPYQACLDGFLYLERGQFDAALTAFGHAGNSPDVQEMKALTIAIHHLLGGEKLIQKSFGAILLTKPVTAKRKESWEALEKLHALLHLAWLCGHCQSAEKRCYLLSLFETQLEKVWSYRLPHPEQALIWLIAEQWRIDSYRWRSSTVRKLKPARNPFIYTRPFQHGEPFQGRESEYNQLKVAWEQGNVQSVMLYGQPLIGKTSLFRYVQVKEANHSIFAVCRIRPSKPTPAAAYQLLTELCHVIAAATGARRLQERAEWRSSYYLPCKRYLLRIVEQLNEQKLIVVFDEFEHAETLFLQRNELKEWMDFLWDLQKSLKNLGFLFVTTAPPEQLRCHLVNPFIGVAHIMHLGYLGCDAVEKLLQHPTPQFMHQFAPDAIKQIFHWTAGQPYLVQLIGNTVVRCFNEPAAQGIFDPFFCKAEVCKAITDPIFKKQCEYYFERVMEAINGNDPDIKGLLQEMALNQKPCLYSDLAAKTSFDATSLSQVLATLKQSDVVDCDQNGQWWIKVKLFRKWLKSSKRQTHSSTPTPPT